MGKVGFGELAFWLVAMRRPTPSETRVFEAVLVALADHGFTPTAIAARLTYLSAPDSLQGALAAGLLGGGSRFLGVTEDCGGLPATRSSPTSARTCRTATTSGTPSPWPPCAAPRRPGATSPASATRSTRTATPGPPSSSRSPRRKGCAARTCGSSRRWGASTSEVLGRRLPLNGAGVCGAALADLGLPVEMLRGFALLARAAGLLGQLAEERRRPIGMDVYLSVDRNAEYVDPQS